MDWGFVEIKQKEKEELFSLLRKKNRNRKGVRETVKKHTLWVDETIKQYLKLKKVDKSSLCVIALGGYGRRQLNPFSDIDIMLLKDNPDEATEELVQELYDLFFSLNYSCSVSTRSTGECIKLSAEDVTIKASLLDERLIYGNPASYDEHIKSIKSEVIERNRESFIEAILAYRDKRHSTYGNTIFVLEPNLKEGVGSLRDYHSLIWIGKVLFSTKNMLELKKSGRITDDDYIQLNGALHFLWQVRNALHFITGKKTDILHIDLREKVASEINISSSSRFSAPERLMRRYYYHAKKMHQLTEKYINDFSSKNGTGNEHKPVYIDKETYIINSRLLYEGPKELLNLFRLLFYSTMYNVSLSEKALEIFSGAIKENTASNRKNRNYSFIFKSMLMMDKPVTRALRTMHDSTLLDRYIPEFGNICCLTEYSFYHKYTVDEHSLQALNNLDTLYHIDIPGSFIMRLAYIWRHLQPHDRLVLRLAVLLHDIGKIKKEKHEIVGAQLARKVAKRLEIGPQLEEKVVFLIENHLMIPRMVSERDLDDPKTMHQFLNVVDTKEKLDLLMLLTFSDMKAVNDNVWNSWKESLIESVYLKAAYYFENKNYDEYLNLVAKESKRRIKKLLGQRYSDLIEQLPNNIFRDIDSESMARYIKDIKDTQRSAFLYKTGKDTDKLIIYYRNEFGLFHKISGVLVCLNINIVSARSYDLKNGMIIDVFDIKLPSDETIQAMDIDRMLKEVDEGKLDLNRCVTSRRSVFLSRAERAKLEISLTQVDVSVDNGISDLYTVIRIKAPDRIGLIYDITEVFLRFRLYIGMFIVDTKGAMAVDTFYVVDEHMKKIYSEKEIEMIKSSLYAILSQ